MRRSTFLFVTLFTLIFLPVFSTAAVPCRDGFDGIGGEKAVAQAKLEAAQAEERAQIERAAGRKATWVEWIAARVGKFALRRRYDVTQHDYETLPARLPGQKGGTLFIFGDHFGLSDPLITYLWTMEKFHLQPLVNEDQANQPGVIGFLLRQMNPIKVPGKNSGLDDNDAAQVDNVARTMAKALWDGKNLGLHLQGELNRLAIGNYDGKTMWKRVQFYYREMSGGLDPRVVLARMDNENGQQVGHWGSSSGYAPAAAIPDRGQLVAARLIDLMLSGFFFQPKRPINMRYLDLSGTPFPWNGDVADQNKFIRDFMQPNPNQRPLNVHVPHRPYKIFGIRLPWGEKPGNVVMPEPQFPTTSVEGDIRSVPEDIKLEVRRYLAELTGVPIEQIDENTHLQQHLGLDSIVIPQINIWLSKRYNRETNLMLSTVEQVMLVASGAPASSSLHVRPPDVRFVRQMQEPSEGIASIPEATRTHIEAFDAQLRRNPDRIFLGDLKTGYFTYREFDSAVKIVQSRVQHFEGDAVGIIMPKSVGGRIALHAIMRAGKTPVELNFTAGTAPVEAVVKANGIKHIVTAGAAIDGLKQKKMEFPGIEGHYWFMDGLKGARPIAALELVARDPSDPKYRLVSTLEFAGRLIERNLAPGTRWNSSNVNEHSLAVVLMTSGSEGVPKQVPLTHKNQLRNAKDLLSELQADRNSRVVNALPDFHSFGEILSRLCEDAGVFEFLSPDPNNGAQLAADVRSNKATHIVLTPTFANLLAHAARPGDLDSLGVILLGAEPIPPGLVNLLKQKAPNAIVVEGYGITEASPVISFNRLHSAVEGSLGHPLPGVETLIVHPKQLAEYKAGTTEDLWEIPTMQKGILLVAGDSIFSGYLNYDKPQPFVKFQGKNWYITDDYIRRDATGRLYFSGRAAREVKIKGERIALDDLEKAMKKTYPLTKDGHQIAVQSTDAKSDQDLFLFTTVPDLDRRTATQALQAGGAPSVATIRGVVYLEKLPVLGSGKVDYKLLKAMLKDPALVAKATGGSDEPAPAVAAKKMTRTEMDALVKTFGRLPVETIGANQVDLAELEDTLHYGIRPTFEPPGTYLPALIVRAYNFTSAVGARPVRRLQIITTVRGLTAQHVQAKLKAAGYPEDFRLEDISYVSRLPMTADNSRPNFLAYTAGRFPAPPDVAEEFGPATTTPR